MMKIKSKKRQSAIIKERVAEL